MEIADRQATAIQTTVKVQILHESETYNFSAVVCESEKYTFVKEIRYLDNYYEKPLKNSVKKKIRNFLSEELLK